MKFRLILLAMVVLLLAACTVPVHTMRATAYGEIVRTQIVAGDRAGAERTAALALKEIDADQNSFNRDFTVAAAAVAQLRAGNPAGAEQTLQRLEGSESPGFVNAILVIALMDAGLEQDARRVAGFGEAGSNGGEDKAMLAWIQAETGDVAGARNTLKKNLDARAATLVALAQARSGDASGALASVEMVNFTLDKNKDVDPVYLITRGIAVDVFGAFDASLFQSETTLKSGALTAAASAFARSGDTQSARRTFELATEAALDVTDINRQLINLAAIGLAQAVAGDRLEALATLARARTIYLHDEGPDSTVSTDARLMVDAVFVAVGGGSDSAGLNEYPDEANRYMVTKAVAQIQLGDLENASATLDKAQLYGPNSKDSGSIAGGLARLAVAWFESGDSVAARRTAARALAFADSIPKTYKDRSLAMFFAAVAFARVGQIDEALAATAAIKAAERPPKTK